MADLAKVNGQQPDFQQHRFFLGGERYFSLKSIGYGWDSKKKPINGQPKKPIGWTEGSVGFKELSIELLRAEAVKLLAMLSKDGTVDPTGQEFDFVNIVRYPGQPLQTDKCLRCTSNSGDLSSAQGEEPDMVKMTFNVHELWVNGIEIGKEDDE